MVDVIDLVAKSTALPVALELAWYQAMQRLRVEQRQPHPQWPPSARYLTPSAPGLSRWTVLLLPLRD